MNRVFRGALFPILIVIVLAFFVVEAALAEAARPGQSHNYQTLITQDLPNGAGAVVHRRSGEGQRDQRHAQRPARATRSATTRPSRCCRR